jgi:hypothetical protein
LIALMNPSSTAGLIPVRRKRVMNPTGAFRSPWREMLPYTCHWMNLPTRSADRAGKCSAINTIGPSGTPSQSRGKTFGG